jgi:cytochrome c oxidase assembly protein subunit 15
VITTVVLAVWAWRIYPRGHAARTGAVFAVVAIFIESAIGAALVLLRLVGSNESFSRGLWLGAHLINTLFLLATLSITAWESTAPGGREGRMPHAGRDLSLAISGFLVAGVLGTFAALGDTFAVPATLSEGLRADFSALSNVFVRVRILHPLAAGALSAWLLLFVARLMSSKTAVSYYARRLGVTIGVVVICQVGMGVANILLKTPVWLQLMHLLGADILWITAVLLASELYIGKAVDSTEATRVPQHPTLTGAHSR